MHMSDERKRHEAQQAGVSLLIKPVSGLCDLRCRYCFYEDETNHRAEKSKGVMTLETAERVIDAAFEAPGAKRGVTFSFQGGEPTLAGLAFFERFVDMVRSRSGHAVPVRYAIQTNGMHIDGQWAAFLAKYRFLVGVSVDGTKALHDENRVDAGGAGTYARAVTAVRTLLSAGADVNVLCVVTGACAAAPQRVYAALRQLGVRYLQFIPCLEPMGALCGGAAYSLSPQAYGKFLCTLFDCWYHDWQRGEYISIRGFDDYVHIAMGMPPASCASCGRCGGYLVIEADGSAYPCDFYALDEWQVGDIRRSSVRELMLSERYAQFVSESETRPSDCALCGHAQLCRGGCRRDWTGIGPSAKNNLCPAYKRFFAYAGERILEMAARERLAHLM